MERLGQLREADEWDLIVVDTPPSRSALDFLDAPERLGRFLDGKLMRFLTAPAGSGPLLLLGAGVGMVTSVIGKLVGAQFLNDLRSFTSAFEAVFGGFQERAERTYRLLRDPGTAFVVVAAPEPDAMREAAFFVRRLASDGMPLAGLVLNRTHPRPSGWAPRRRSRLRRPWPGPGSTRWPRLRCGCMPNGRARAGGNCCCATGSSPRIRACGSRRWPLLPVTCTTSPDCVGSGSVWQVRDQPAGRGDRGRRLAVRDETAAGTHRGARDRVGYRCSRRGQYWAAA